MESPRFDLDALRPWIDVEFDRSGGPGGQNVNKVSTRAALLFDFHACALLTPDEKHRISRRLASRLSSDGRLRIVAQSERSQMKNRREAEDRLVTLLCAATHVDRPRRPTKPSAGSRRRRLNEKKARGETKRARRGASHEQD